MTIDSKISRHYLYPSNLHVSREPCQVTTVLGSCVSVCLIDEEKKVGGINHFMLPLWNGKGLASAKYGNIAIDKLIEEMLRNGANKRNLKAKLFGGANQANFTMKIGDRNVELAKDVLAEKGIPVVAESTGGHQGRKIIFDTETGAVRMKMVNSGLNGVQ